MAADPAVTGRRRWPGSRGGKQLDRRPPGTAALILDLREQAGTGGADHDRVARREPSQRATASETTRRPRGCPRCRARRPEGSPACCPATSTRAADGQLGAPAPSCRRRRWHRWRRCPRGGVHSGGLGGEPAESRRIHPEHGGQRPIYPHRAASTGSAARTPGTPRTLATVPAGSESSDTTSTSAGSSLRPAYLLGRTPLPANLGAGGRLGCGDRMRHGRPPGPTGSPGKTLCPWWASPPPPPAASWPRPDRHARAPSQRRGIRLPPGLQTGRGPALLDASTAQTRDSSNTHIENPWIKDRPTPDQTARACRAGLVVPVTACRASPPLPASTPWAVYPPAGHPRQPPRRSRAPGLEPGRRQLATSARGR